MLASGGLTVQQAPPNRCRVISHLTPSQDCRFHPGLDDLAPSLTRQRRAPVQF